MIIPFTLKQGEAAVLWRPNGTRRFVEGPKVIFAPFDELEMLRRFVARDGEYLAIQFVDGTTEHLAGPCERWLDPLLHETISIRPAVNLDAHEAVVVYREKGGEVTHRVLRGPAVYVPQPNEWLHEFRWHGDNGKGQKVPRALKFEKLRVIPDQMYFDVDGVRTSDEALIVVRLMVFFELDEIERMLGQTHDPIADFINALSADIIRFAGARDFETFKTEAGNLNELDTYPELTRGAERIGYRITKVVYRGYLAPTKLQQMHDNAIETRTALVLESETEERRQEIADFQQTHEHDRAARERGEEQRTQEHRLRQQRETRQEELAGRREQAELELELRTRNQEAEEAHRSRLLQIQAEEWIRLEAAGADLTAVLVARERNPDKLIRLEQEGTKGHDLHLHEAI